MRLEGKVALITGGGSGIGRATAQLFCEEGAIVVVADSNPETGGETAELIRTAGGEAIFVHADVSRFDQVQQMVQATVDAFGRIDLVFNNAGILLRGSVTETEEEEWDRVMAVNLKSVYLVSKCAIPHMIAAGGGSIINMSSSTGAHLAGPGAAAYITSKGGVALLTKCMAIDCARYGIRVNCVCPGPTDTPMLAKTLSEQQLKDFAATLPVGRLASPREIAEAVLFLASDEASFVTGLAMAVDGGQTAGLSTPRA